MCTFVHVRNAVAAVAGRQKIHVPETPSPARFPNKNLPNQHDRFASTWTMSLEGSAAKRDAVSDGTISITVSGSAGVATYKRYGVALPCLICAFVPTGSGLQAVGSYVKAEYICRGDKWKRIQMILELRARLTG